MELTIRNISKTYANGVRPQRREPNCSERHVWAAGAQWRGKSSLMHTIATLQEPGAGSIILGDIDLLTNKDAVRRVLGYLPQEFGLYPIISAEVLLDHFASLKGIRDGQTSSSFTQTSPRRRPFLGIWHKPPGTTTSR